MVFPSEKCIFEKSVEMRIFGRREKPTGFNYIPQFYDERKEKLDNLMKDYNTTDEASMEAMKARIKMGYSSRPYYYDKNNTGSKLRRKSNMRVMLIIAILLILLITALTNFGTILQEIAK